MFRWLYRTGIVFLLAGLLALAGLYIHSYRRADAVTLLIHTSTTYRFQVDRGRFRIYCLPHLGQEVFWINHTDFEPKTGSKLLDQACSQHFIGFGYTGQQSRYQIWPGGSTKMVDVFVLVVPGWAMLILWALLFVGYTTLSHRIRQRHRLRRGLCSKCGYDLRGSENTCPECGQVITT